MSVYDQLKALNIELPPVAVPAAAYVPFVQTGNLVSCLATSPKKTAKSGPGSWAKTPPPPKANKPLAPWPLT